jgi:hypothetical protein
MRSMLLPSLACLLALMNATVMHLSCCAAVSSHDQAASRVMDAMPFGPLGQLEQTGSVSAMQTALRRAVMQAAVTVQASLAPHCTDAAPKCKSSCRCLSAVLSFMSQVGEMAAQMDDYSVSSSSA